MLRKLPANTKGLRRLLEENQGNGTDFIITECKKGGYVIGNRSIGYQYNAEEIISRLERVASKEGTVLYGIVTVKNGKINKPISEDALVSFSEDEPVFPIGHYINALNLTIKNEDTES